MKLARLELARFALPLVAAVQTSRALHQSREGFVLRLTSSDGAVGYGEATPLPGHGTESLAACEAALRQAAPALLHMAIDDLGALESLLRRALPSASPAARCGLELGLLDLQGQERGLPVAGLLAQRVHASVPINALLVAQGPDALEAEAAARVEQGFATLKLKVGGRPLEEDLERVRAVSRAAPAQVALRLDANGGWTLEQARRALPALCAERKLELCEQPVASVAELRALRPAPCLIAADELLCHPSAADELLAGGAADVLVLKPMVLGGVIPALALARRAQEAGIAALVTTGLDGAIARAAALHLAAALPGEPLHASGLATGFVFADDLAPDASPALGGRMVVPTTPGLGVKPEPARLGWEALA